jgi:3-hydroxyisobutyrate dehydrogenase-like beta-hydroxyacid dehydrogenase
MKLTISTVALVALATAVSAATAGVSQDRIPDAQRPGAIDAPGITLTGCVARGTATDTYTLAEAKKDATAAPATATATAAPAELVALTGTEVDLSKHVGHSVTVTGSYTGTDGATGTSGTEKPAAPATTEDTKKAAKTFTVKSLKMVAPSC